MRKLGLREVNDLTEFTVKTKYRSDGWIRNKPWFVATSLKTAESGDVEYFFLYFYFFSWTLDQSFSIQVEVTVPEATWFDLHSFPRQTIQYDSNPSLYPNH